MVDFAVLVYYHDLEFRVYCFGVVLLHYNQSKYNQKAKIAMRNKFVFGLVDSMQCLLIR